MVLRIIIKDVDVTGKLIGEGMQNGCYFYLCYQHKENKCAPCMCATEIHCLTKFVFDAI